VTEQPNTPAIAVPDHDCSDAFLQIEALRQLGADRLDPVWFHHLERLAEKARDCQGRVKDLLDAKVLSAIGAYRARIEREQDRLSANSHVCRNDAPSGSLAMLVARLEHRPSQVNPVRSEVADSGHELKSVVAFRNTWSKLSARKEINQALANVPTNAGPLNSQRVALRSLSIMSSLSPDYLHRFMSYVDTLARLEQTAMIGVAIARPSRERELPKKPKANRSRSLRK
jgi:hypothetical protein